MSQVTVRYGKAARPRPGLRAGTISMTLGDFRAAKQSMVDLRGLTVMLPVWTFK
ncbi:MAG TPA: hypothetical protein VN969_24395 [Streptosporangiaceae bacterium]|nr:hypothetical protein [Streptosporangiaceae bacterium]